MLTVEYVKDMQWENAEHSLFSCAVKYKEFSGELPAGIDPQDSYVHVKEIWAKAIAGEYGVIAEYVAPPEPEIQTPRLESAPQPTVDGAQTL